MAPKGKLSRRKFLEKAGKGIVIAAAAGQGARVARARFISRHAYKLSEVFSRANEILVGSPSEGFSKGNITEAEDKAYSAAIGEIYESKLERAYGTKVVAYYRENWPKRLNEYLAEFRKAHRHGAVPMPFEIERERREFFRETATRFANPLRLING